MSSRSICLGLILSVILCSPCIAASAGPAPEDFSPKNDQGLAPLRPCYAKWIQQLDNGSITERDLVQAVIAKCSRETQAFIDLNLNNGMLGAPGDRGSANATITYWAGGVVRWMRTGKK